MARSNITIYDVAARAGVSKSTVSRVLQNDDRVSDRAREAVETAIQELSYVPAASARGLRSGENTSVGLLIRNIYTPIYAQLNYHLQNQFLRLGRHIIQESVVGPYREFNEERLLQNLVSLRVKGIIVASGTIPSEAVANYAKRLPIMVVGRPEPNETLHNVAYAQESHGQMMAEHLYSMGHREIVIETVEMEYSMGSWARNDALIRHAEKLGMTTHPVDVTHDPDYSDILNRVIRGSDSTAVVALHDKRALQLWRLLRAEGIRVPEDLSIMGSDGVLPGGDLLGLVSLRQPVEKIAEVAASNMNDLIDGRAPATPPIRESVRGWITKGTTVARIEL